MVGKHYLKIAILAVGCSISAMQASAGGHGYCERYARHALEQFEVAKGEGCPNLNYPVWSMDFNHHYNWCREAPEAQVSKGEEQRLDVLRKCRNRSGQGAVIGTVTEVDTGRIAASSRQRSCQDYAKNAVSQQQRNQGARCGLRGPQWNPNYNDHYNWCMHGENLKYTSTEQQKRQLALERCGTRAHSVKFSPSDKISLWNSGETLLRGANVFQRRVYPEYDDGYIGDGQFGPPFAQAELNSLSALGANYVNLSTHGVFTEKSPYMVNPSAVVNLDLMISMIERADMFVVISIRTGPGRDELALTCEEGTPESPSEWPCSAKNNAVFTSTQAQEGWAAMWAYIANRYKDRKVVAGYDLMVEPNPAGDLLQIDEPEKFYPKYKGSIYDWNQFFPKIVAAIRKVDVDTPIIIGGMNWSSAKWMPQIRTVNTPNIVYAFHQYEPQDYTHQSQDDRIVYPGRGAITSIMAYVDRFREKNGSPAVVANEFGIHRYAPSAATFMKDQIAAFEARSINYAYWDFVSRYPTQQSDNDDFDIMHGSNPNNHRSVKNSLLNVVRTSFSRNRVRPSNVDF